MESIEDRLLATFAEKFGGQPELSDDLTYLGVDSVGMAELTLEIEQQFGIRVRDDIVAADTVQDLCDYIRERQSASDS